MLIDTFIEYSKEKEKHLQRKKIHKLLHYPSKVFIDAMSTFYKKISNEDMSMEISIKDLLLNIIPDSISNISNFYSASPGTKIIDGKMKQFYTGEIIEIIGRYAHLLKTETIALFEKMKL